MADLSRLNFFNKLDARARVFVLFLGVIGLILLVYLGTKYLGGSDKTVGPSRVASAPSGLQSIPGGTTATAEYQRALNQANVQVAEAAKMSGGSAIPTQINTGSVSFGPGSCVVCSDKSASVKRIIDEWVRQGKINPEAAGTLIDLASKNVSVDEYAGTLDKLVKDGKLTPAQARELLEEYKKQHANALLSESEKQMDEMIKSGDLSLDAANQLLEAQRKGVGPAEYAAMLQKMVQDKKISPATAQRLLKQYTEQRMKEALKQQVATINAMAAAGSLTPEVAKKLTELTEKNVPVDVYARELNSLVSQGKITPEAAAKLLKDYKALKAANGTLGTVDALLQKAEDEAFQEISDLLAAGKISPETAAQLTSLIQNNVSMDDFKAAISNMVANKSLTPEISQLKINDYIKVKQYREVKQQLEDLQANNASPSEYAEALKRMVAAKLITPAQAEQLLKDYQNFSAQPGVPIPEGAFGALAQKVANASAEGGMTTEDFSAAQAQAALETAQERQTRLENLMTAMNGQATQLIASWQPPTMAHKERAASTLSTGTTTTTTSDLTAGSSTTTTTSTTMAPVLIKGGNIIFAVLDTAINSDYPDTPVLATIVEGKYKGGKLLGKIVTTKGVTGQMDRVSLTFTLMNLDEWPKSKPITAFGIDPDTARTAIASSVDYHYMMRYGAMMATSFLQGYSTAITTSGSTSTTGIFGTSTVSPTLSPANKFMVGLGQVGQSLGAATQNYINRPPTVRVDSGVSLGILFMTDVT
jgi:polyhydroxyalkanoate synthesis regulator phasin/type IV secretory pathway VirB10-like protein